MNKLTKSQIANFVSEFNSCFGDDWLPEGLAHASVAVTGGIRIFIGNRDIQFDNDMHIVGRGTSLTLDKYGKDLPRMSSRRAVESSPPDDDNPNKPEVADA